MGVSLPFKREHSPIFGIIHRPIAQISIKHKTEDIWRELTMIIDTGADYTLLPRFLTDPLGVNVSKDCKVIETQGVGGQSKVYLCMTRMKIKLGHFTREIPLGFLSHNYIPPLLGRHEFFETFKVIFEKWTVTFE